MLKLNGYTNHSNRLCSYVATPLYNSIVIKVTNNYTISVYVAITFSFVVLSYIATYNKLLQI